LDHRGCEGSSVGSLTSPSVFSEPDTAHAIGNSAHQATASSAPYTMPPRTAVCLMTPSLKPTRSLQRSSMADPQLHHGQQEQDGEHHPCQRGGISEFEERERVLEQ